MTAGNRPKSSQDYDLVEHIDLAFLELDHDLTVVHANRKALELTKTAHGELAVGRYLWDVFPDGREGKFDRLYSKVLKTQRPGQALAHYERSDRWFEVTAVPGGQGLYVYYWDKTDAMKRSEAEQVLVQERQILHDLFMQVPAGMAVLHGRDHIYQLVNDAYANMFPGSREFVGRSVREVFPEAVDQGILVFFDSVYLTGRAHVSKEMLIEINHPDLDRRDTFYFNFVLQPLRERDGRVRGVMVHITDVTEFVTTRKAIEAANAQYREKEQALVKAESLLETLLDQSHSRTRPKA